MQDFIDFPSNMDMDIGAQAPVAQVILAKGIEWDNSYIHVRAYDSVNALVQHVQSKAVWSSNNCSPVKEGTYAFSPDSNSADINDCNYIAFKNAPYSDKWEFGFITDVTWKSHNSCVVTWEYDVFSMCWYGATLKPCFVERMHIAKSDDLIGANLVQENLETGPLDYVDQTPLYFGSMNIGMLVTEMPRGEPPTELRGLYNNVYSGLYPYARPATQDGVDAINALIDQYDEGNADAIQLIYMYPDVCGFDEEGQPRTYTIRFSIKHNYGYTPKNNKLFTYPYTRVRVDDHQGNSMDFKPELFSVPAEDITVGFNSTGVRFTTPSVWTVPYWYAGSQENSNFGFVSSNFPQCAWSVDTFKLWYGQNRNTIGLSMVSSVMNSLTGAGAGAVKGAVAGGGLGAAVGGLSGFTSGVSGIANIMAEIEDKKALPDQAKGRLQADSINTALGLNRIDMWVCRPTLQMCKVLDDFWTAFGYPIHEITTPLVNSRSAFNYVKTVDCGFTADADLNLLKEFRNIFNNGVTIWHTDDVGNYSLTNN